MKTKTTNAVRKNRLLAALSGVFLILASIVGAIACSYASDSTSFTIFMAAALGLGAVCVGLVQPMLKTGNR